jgi:hypothetical protein
MIIPKRALQINALSFVGLMLIYGVAWEYHDAISLKGGAIGTVGGPELIEAATCERFAARGAWLVTEDPPTGGPGWTIPWPQSKDCKT